MPLDASEHWQDKRRYRRDITDDILEYAIANAPILLDRDGDDALNAICRIPPSGRILKVVYRRTGKTTYLIITAYWLS